MAATSAVESRAELSNFHMRENRNQQSASSSTEQDISEQAARKLQQGSRRNEQSMRQLSRALLLLLLAILPHCDAGTCPGLSDDAQLPAA